MTKVYAQWPEPPEVMAHRNQEEAKLMKWLSWIMFKWSVLLGLPTGIIVSILQPSVLPVVFYAVLGLTLFSPIWLWLTCHIPLKHSKVRCVIDEDGLSVRLGKFGYLGRPCKWSEITAYDFADHDVLIGIRCLKIRLHHTKKGSKLYFRPEQVDEYELRRLMESRKG